MIAGSRSGRESLASVAPRPALSPRGRGSRSSSPYQGEEPGVRVRLSSPYQGEGLGVRVDVGY